MTAEELRSSYLVLADHANKMFTTRVKRSVKIGIYFLNYSHNLGF